MHLKKLFFFKYTKAEARDLGWQLVSVHSCAIPGADPCETNEQLVKIFRFSNTHAYMLLQSTNFVDLLVPCQKPNPGCCINTTGTL